MRLSYLVVLAIGLAAGFVVGFSIRPTPPPEPRMRDHESRGQGPGERPEVADRPESALEATPPPVESGEITAVEAAPERASPTPKEPEADRLLRAARWKFREAGISLDPAREQMIEVALKAAAAGFAKEERYATARRATRRKVEARLERQIRMILDSEQVRALDARLDGRAFVETLPGGTDGDTLSSTGVTVDKIESLVLENLRRRIGFPTEPSPGLRSRVTRYVSRVRTLTDELTRRHGRGFVEAICSGPTPHTEAARDARSADDYGPASLEVRARLWRLQADLEEMLLPWLDDTHRAKLRDARPTALRFLVLER